MRGAFRPQPLGACTTTFVRSKKKILLCYLSVLYIYTDRREIKLCKKFIYSYSTRLTFHMPGLYLLTILSYFIVVPASGELPCTYSGKLKLKHQSVTYFWVKITSNSYHTLYIWGKTTFCVRLLLHLHIITLQTSAVFQCFYYTLNRFLISVNLFQLFSGYVFPKQV